jgi:filamentous hemagglutinin family protein
MASFTKGGTAKTPFGKNTYLRSTKSLQFESYTCAANTVPAQTIDGVAGQKILQPGTILAKITSGPDSGKVGPFQAAGTADVWTITPGGTWSGGTFTITVNGQTTPAIAYNASNATIQTAVQALSSVGSGNMTVGGGPQATAATTYTAAGNLQGSVTISISVASVTGTSPTATPVHTTTGVAGALDGRSTTSNIVGVNDTFLPWELMEHDCEVAALYAGTVVQGWCFEYNAAGTPIACQNATATAMFAQKGLDVLFK